MDTIVYNGNSDKHINFVILSDGYTTNELSKFVIDATKFKDYFFSETPYSNYKNYFNVFIIKVPSNQSGASHPGTATDVPEPLHPLVNIDNYFGSTFDYSCIHRLLVATKTIVISNVLASNFPDYDQVLILVNSPYYGGSGGYYATASTNESSIQIAIHEIGHSFVGLKDEYWSGDQYASEGINMTKQTNPFQVKWKNWINVNDIGIYQHCCGGNSSLWYKPHRYCLMQYYIPYIHFCSVCTQATIEKIHSITTPIISYDPFALTVTDTVYPLKFILHLTAPIPNTLSRKWILNDSQLLQNIDSVIINESNLLKGRTILKVIIEDTTNLLRVDNHSSIHISKITWTIDRKTTGIGDIKSSSSEMTIDYYPNPTSGVLNIKFSGNIMGNIKLELYDMNGKMIKIYKLQSDVVNSVNLDELGHGLYLAKVFMDNTLISTSKIIRN